MDSAGFGDLAQIAEYNRGIPRRSVEGNPTATGTRCERSGIDTDLDEARTNAGAFDAVLPFGRPALGQLVGRLAVRIRLGRSMALSQASRPSAAAEQLADAPSCGQVADSLAS